MLDQPEVFAAVQAAVDAAPAGRATGVLMLRLHRLRETSLALGYDVGEAHVEAVRHAVASALRPQDRVWRVGEGEFIALLPGLQDRNHAALAAAKVVRVLQAPLPSAGQRVLPVPSVGIAAAPDDGVDGIALCRFADLACDAADHASERFAFYQAPKVVAAFAYGDLRDAIATNRLDLHLQPIADLRSGRIARAEALSRWTHPTLGAIAPDVFVHVAEQTGLVAELTRWSLNVALRHLAEASGAQREGRGDRVPLLAVNVAPDALQQPGFAEQVRDLLRFWDVAPDRLMLEITEGGLMREPERCERILRALREAGIGVAIDDFGTGYSSMAYLRRLPANELKIDRSFVQDMRADARARKLVASMIDVSHHLGMETVAEGVEDADTLALLQSLGCDYAQGYHIGRPAPAAGVMPTLSGAAPD